MLSRRSFIKGIGACATIALTPIPQLWANDDDDRSIRDLIISQQASQGVATNWVDDSRPASNAPHPHQKAHENTNYLPGNFPLSIPATGEAYTLKFREGDQYDLTAFQWVNWLLRCNGDRNAMTTIDYRLIEHLNYISHWFGGRVIRVHSGYRTPAYNRKLVERNRKAAPNSFHMAGRAIDFSVEGVKLRDVCSVALYCRNTQGFGGVGYYPGDGFLHIDTGPTRQWVG